MTGVDLVGDVPPTHWLVDDYYDPDPAAPDRTYARRGAFLSPVDFPPLTYGVPPSTLPATDTTQLLALLVAEQVLADAAGGDLSTLDRDRVSVILGTGAMELLYSMSNRMQRPVWLKAMREHGIGEPDAQAVCDRIADHYVPWQEATFPGLLGNVVAGRVANRFDLHGTNHTTDAACASSLAAISSAVNELALGHARHGDTGGVDTLNDIVMYMCFSKTPALSPSGDCRPFSDDADGTILGEGLAMLALKRLADAERDGDTRLRRAAGDRQLVATGAAPRSTRRCRPARREPSGARTTSAGYGPETVELVEAHGTGTKAGDGAEFTALSRGVRRVGPCRTGSGARSGRSSRRSVTRSPPRARPGCSRPRSRCTTRCCRRPSRSTGRTRPRPGRQPALPQHRGPAVGARRRASAPGVGVEFRLRWLQLPRHTRGVRADTGRRRAPRRAAAECARRARPGRRRLAGRAGRPPPELAESADRLVWPPSPDGRSRVSGPCRPCGRRWSRPTPTTCAARPARSSPAGPRTRRCRSSAPGVHVAAGPADPGKLALLFPGQGSQYVGMGAGITMHLPRAQAVWDRAAGLGVGDLPLDRVVFPVPVFDDEDRAAQQALLTRTEWAQPALAVHSLALLSVLDGLGVRADCLGGHSFGELVALQAAGAFDADTLVRTARVRGELMRDAAATPGAMLAVAPPRAEVERMLATAGTAQVWVANDNGPSQVVVSGAADSVAELARWLADAGVATKPVNAAAAFHSPLVADACGPFAEYLAGVDVRAPDADVYSNADTEPYPRDPEQVRRRLADHLATPVRFTDQIEAMYRDGVRTFVEVGAGSTLARLVGRILGDRAHLAVSLDRKSRNGVTSFARRPRAAGGQRRGHGIRELVGGVPGTRRRAAECFRRSPPDDDDPVVRHQLRPPLPARGGRRRPSRPESGPRRRRGPRAACPPRTAALPRPAVRAGGRRRRDREAGARHPRSRPDAALRPRGHHQPGRLGRQCSSASVGHASVGYASAVGRQCCGRQRAGQAERGAAETSGPACRRCRATCSMSMPPISARPPRRTPRTSG